METWTVNGEVYDEKPYPLKAGRRYRLLFQNKTEEDHPLHLHRFPFEVTRIHGRAVGGLWKDVVVLERYAQLDVDFIPTECGLVLFTWRLVSKSFSKSDKSRCLVILQVGSALYGSSK